MIRRDEMGGEEESEAQMIKARQETYRKRGNPD